MFENGKQLALVEVREGMREASHQENQELNLLRGVLQSQEKGVRELETSLLRGGRRSDLNK